MGVLVDKGVTNDFMISKELLFSFAEKREMVEDL
jgi:hypothetical protein